MQSFVLVVGEDERVFADITRAVECDGYRTVAARGPAEICGPRESRPVVTILTTLDAVDWCERLRGEGVDEPILMVSERATVPTRVAALEAGADDFLANPFAPLELRARVRALARRGPLGHTNKLERGAVRLDFGRKLATADGRDVHLSPREWSIIQLLASRPDRAVSREHILARIGLATAESGSSSLEVLIARIRRKLGAGFIRTIRSVGYALGSET